jgi:CubicO group peptidase (beta-lactamase class C family)
MELGFERVLRICQTAVTDEVVPGLVLLVGSGGRTVFHQAFGQRQVTPHRLRALPDTVYDVASLTKAVVTSLLAMQLVDRGVLALDELVGARVPEFQGPGKESVTIRHLLAHAAGLPAHRPFWRTAPAAPSQRWAIPLLAVNEPLEYPPGARSLYSDLGFIVLGLLLERAAGQRLDVQAERAIFQPLGLSSTSFVNLADSEARATLLASRSVAATQSCPQRQRLVLGEVDDLNAYAMGGIAGHAGLFTTAADLGRLAGALVAAWKGPAAGNLIGQPTIREFWASAGVAGSTWRLGWDGPAPADSQAGRRLSRAAVGHLGFTGCSLWIDPQRELWVVLLSNRVHPQVPGPADIRFRQLRPRLHDAILEDLGVPET